MKIIFKIQRELQMKHVSRRRLNDGKSESNASDVIINL